ncbi:MAG: FixH family protein [candidate division Zixibacteria bacterium]|nr:FixH family protein [candidate division Zixibacteria bacterium]
MTEKNKKSKWGFGLFFLYGGFVAFMLSIVLYVSIQDFQLVEKNYYKIDLAYQDQIDRMDRTNQLEKKLTINLSPVSENFLVTFPVEIDKEISGVIEFFRPSNARLDFKVPIETDSLGVQEVGTKSMARGYWKVKVNWTVDSVEYYSQETIMIN